MTTSRLAGKLLPLLRLTAHLGILLVSSDAPGDILLRLLFFQPQILLIIFIADNKGSFRFSGPLSRELLFLHLLLKRLLTALKDGIRNAGCKKPDRAKRVIIARDHIIDKVGVAIRVHNRDNRNAELPGFQNRNLFLVRIDHKKSVREAWHIFDARQVLLQVLALAFEPLNLFFGQQVISSVPAHLLQFTQPLDRPLDRSVIGQQSSKPAVVDVEHLAALGLFGNGLLRLALGPNEQNDLSLPSKVG